MSCLFQELLDELNAMFMPLELENNSGLTVLEGNWLLNRHPSAKLVLYQNAEEILLPWKNSKNI